MEISNYRIVMPKNPGHIERRAATFLQQQIRIVRGVKIPIVTDETEPRDWEFVIGRTTREFVDGLEFVRYPDGVWEYIIKTHGTRVYLTGLGNLDTEEKPYTSGYTLMNDNAHGTVYAVYRYVEAVLGYDFSYLDWEGFPTYDTLDVPEYNYTYTREELKKQQVKKIDGAALYSLQSCEIINWSINCYILKTKGGKLVVMDGGRAQDLERLLSALEFLSDGKKPVVDAWFITHLHTDHYGAFYELCTNEEMQKRVTVKNFYHNLLPEKFYERFPSPKMHTFAESRKGMLACNETLGAEVHRVETGDKIVIDEFEFDIIHAPYFKDMLDMNVNDTSVVIRLNYNKGEQGIMFLADAEHVCSNDMTDNFSDKIKSDVVQVGHHGCGNVSKKCYATIGAKVYLWPTCQRNWYGDNSEGPHTHNIGVLRTRTYMKELGIKPENIYRCSLEIQSFKLPIEIK